MKDKINKACIPDLTSDVYIKVKTCSLIIWYLSLIDLALTVDIIKKDLLSNSLVLVTNRFSLNCRHSIQLYQLFTKHLLNWQCLQWICYKIHTSSYQDGSVGIPLTALIPPHFCACPKPGPGFPMSHVLVFFFVFSELRFTSDCLFC